MKRVLFVAELETQLMTQLEVAKLLQSTGRYSCVMYADHPLPYRLERMRQLSNQAGLPLVEATDYGLSVWLLLSRLLIGPAKFFFLCWHLFQRQIREARRVLKAQRPNILVLGEDGIGGNGSLIKYAHAAGIKIVVVPYEYSTITQHLDDLVYHHEYRRSYGMVSAINRWVARRYPHWLYHRGDEPLLRQSGLKILPQEWLGIAPPKPWTVHGGSADVLAVESLFMMNHYRREGLPESKLRLTGTLFDDVLTSFQQRAAQARAALYQEYGFDEDKPLILCGLPSDFTFRNNTSPTNDFRQLLQSWVTLLSAQAKMNVIYHPHPSIKPEYIKFLHRVGALLAHQNIAELIPVSNLFVISISSTIRWAIACGIPVINYDVFKLRLGDYDEAAGVITVETWEDFSRTIAQLTDRPSALAELVARQRSIMNDWGLHDGRSGQRILALFDEIVTR